MLLPPLLISQMQQQHSCTPAVNVCLPIWKHVEERKLASAAAFGWGSRLLQGSRESRRSPNISLQSALQTTDGGGPPTRQPMGAAVQINVSGLPQSHA